MRCNSIKHKLQALYDNELTYFDRLELENHIRACAKCQKRYAEIRKYMGSVRHLLEHKPNLSEFKNAVLSQVSHEPMPQKPVVASLWDFIGDVTIHHKLSGIPRKVEGKSALGAEDRISVGGSGKALLTFHDGSEFCLGEHTDLGLPKIPHRREVFLYSGTLYADITKQQEEFKVDTPVGQITVKGTRFICQVSPRGEVILTVLHGLVEFANKIGSVLIPAESFIECTESVLPPSPKPCDVSKSLNWTSELFHKHLKNSTRLSSGIRRSIIKSILRNK